MVSGGTVLSALDSFKSSMDSYKSQIGGLGSWQGASHDNLVAKAEEFASSFTSAISGQMSSFASACDLYIEYEDVKKNLAIARSNYNSASEENKSNYSGQISSLQTKLDTLKTQIEAALAAAGGTSLEASSTTSSVDASAAAAAAGGDFTAGKPLGIAAGTYEYTYTSPTTGKQMKYYAYIPNNATEGMPLILYLHGDGSVNNMKALKNGEMTRFVSNIYGQDFPFIYIQPMTEVTSWTKDGRDDTVAELVQDVAKQYKCDTDRIVLTGHSRGGNGSWSVANKYSNLFSCFVPISGRDNNVNPNNLTNLPVVAVSSPSSSDSWNYSHMQTLVKKINAAGGNATFVSKKGTTHSSVCKATYTDEMFQWMISQNRKNNNKANNQNEEQNQAS